MAEMIKDVLQSMTSKTIVSSSLRYFENNPNFKNEIPLYRLENLGEENPVYEYRLYLNFDTNDYFCLEKRLVNKIENNFFNFFSIEGYSLINQDISLITIFVLSYLFQNPYFEYLYFEEKEILIYMFILYTSENRSYTGLDSLSFAKEFIINDEVILFGSVPMYLDENLGHLMPLTTSYTAYESDSLFVPTNYQDLVNPNLFLSLEVLAEVSRVRVKLFKKFPEKNRNTLFRFKDIYGEQKSLNCITQRFTNVAGPKFHSWICRCNEQIRNKEKSVLKKFYEDLYSLSLLGEEKIELSPILFKFEGNFLIERIEELTEGNNCILLKTVDLFENERNMNRLITLENDIREAVSKGLEVKNNVIQKTSNIFLKSFFPNIECINFSEYTEDLSIKFIEPFFPSYVIIGSTKYKIVNPKSFWQSSSGISKISFMPRYGNELKLKVENLQGNKSLLPNNQGGNYCLGSESVWHFLNLLEKDVRQLLIEVLDLLDVSNPHLLDKESFRLVYTKDLHPGYLNDETIIINELDREALNVDT